MDGITAKYHRLKGWFFHETWALPVDIFRVLVGVLCVFYFSSLFLQTEDFSNPDGLIDHDFYLKAFWWLKINLIWPGVDTSVFYVLTALAIVGSFGIIVGYRIKLISAVLFVIAVCIQRWNFAVMFIDDAVMHILLFWLLLLPVGRTLVLGDWLREGNACFPKWLRTRVPGFPVSCFIGNVCWIYFFAGLTKLASPLWREGLALYAVLLVPISRMPDFWQPEHIPFLRLLTYAALLTEISLPFLLLSPKGSWRKWTGLTLQVSFNLGIVLALEIPFANIALIASAVLFFREELMEAILRRYDHGYESGLKGQPLLSRKVRVSSAIALAFVVLVCMSTLRRIPILSHVGIPTTKALWAIGVTQDYKLFDWIDRTNYHLDQQVKFYPPGNSEPKEMNPTTIFPHSTRHALIQARVYDVYWLIRIPSGLKAELEQKTRRRIKNRACREVGESGSFVIRTTIHHVTSDNLELRKRPRVDVMRFRCFQGKLINNSRKSAVENR